MEKKEFNTLELTVIYFNKDDVVRTSLGGGALLPGEDDFD